MGEYADKRLLNRAALLTFAAFMTKALSIGYRIPYQNMTGDYGIYIYQQVYPIHGIIFTLAMYGFPVALSKLLAEGAGERQFQERLLVASFIVFTLVSLCAFIGLFFLSPLIAMFVGDVQLTLVYRTMAFALLFIPFVSLLRGLFQSEGDVIPTATSQLLEQVVRVVAIVTVAYYVMARTGDLYHAGAGAAFGSIVGGLTGVCVLALFYWRRRGPSRRKWRNVRLEWARMWPLMKRLLTQGFIISLGALVFIFFQLIDSLTMINQFLSLGLELGQAKVLKGVYDRGQPLLQLGFTLATSLSLVLVPTIAAAYTYKRREAVTEHAGFALKITFAVSAAASLGLLIVIESTNIMLFKNNDGSALLALLGLAIFFGSLALTAIAILQGVGDVRATLWIVLLGIIVKAGMNVTLIAKYGVMQAALATVIAFATMALGAITLVQKRLQIFQRYPFQFFKIIVALGGMAAMAFAWKQFIASSLPGDGRVVHAVVALSTVLIAVIVYGGLLLRLRVFTKSGLKAVLKRNKGGAEDEN